MPAEARRGPARPVATAAAPPVLGRRERRRRATRSELIRAGRRLFGEKGLYESRIEDLAELAGIAKGTLYLYFPSKEAIVQAVVEDAFAELGRRVEEAASAARGRRARVAALADAHLAFFEEHPDLMRVLHQVRGLLEFHRPEWRGLRRPLAAHVARIERLLAAPSGTARRRAGGDAGRRGLALLVFGGVSGACSVRAALESGPAAGRWSSLVRDGLAALAAGLERGNGAAARRAGGRA